MTKGIGPLTDPAIYLWLPCLRNQHNHWGLRGV